jgi:hypothetical protein
MPLSRINSAAIANNSVIAADIAAGSVTGDKLGLTAINANNIVDNTITAAKLATGIAAQYVDNQSTAVVYYNGQNVTSNITISADRNAFTAGPITINDPFSVTLNAGSTWVIL